MAKSQDLSSELLELIKSKGIFSEYLPNNFNIDSTFNIFGAGASHKDKVEPYSYYMSRFTGKGDRRMISIPEISGYVALVNFLRDNKQILRDIIMLSQNDNNSFSRIINEDYEIVDVDTYGRTTFSGQFTVGTDGKENQREDHSAFIESMIRKIKKMKGANGILHVDISEFYRSIYTHSLCAIGIGVDRARKAFLEDSQDPVYKMYCQLDDRVRRLNGARTNGILIGPFISRVLSEAILAKVDEELEDLGLIFVRYADDYEVAIYNEVSINDIKSKLVGAFERYFFRINNEKTFYEKYPFYVFKNYDRIIRSILPEGTSLSEEDTEELFSTFQKLEAEGEKGAVRYLLKEYRGKYTFRDKELYTSYLLNMLFNEEKVLGLVCSIIADDYKENRINIDQTFYDIIYKKLQKEIKERHDLEAVWLVYLLRLTEYEADSNFLKMIFESGNELAMIIAIEEWRDKADKKDLDLCWESANSWLLLYQFSLHDEKKRPEFFSRLGITHNVDFYEKLFNHEFSFYKVYEKI